MPPHSPQSHVSAGAGQSKPSSRPFTPISLHDRVRPVVAREIEAFCKSISDTDPVARLHELQKQLAPTIDPTELLFHIPPESFRVVLAVFGTSDVELPADSRGIIRKIAKTWRLSVDYLAFLFVVRADGCGFTSLGRHFFELLRDLSLLCPWEEASILLRSGAHSRRTSHKLISGIKKAQPGIIKYDVKLVLDQLHSRPANQPPPPRPLSPEATSSSASDHEADSHSAQSEAKKAAAPEGRSLAVVSVDKEAGAPEEEEEEDAQSTGNEDDDGFPAQEEQELLPVVDEDGVDESRSIQSDAARALRASRIAKTPELISITELPSYISDIEGGREEAVKATSPAADHLDDTSHALNETPTSHSSPARSTIIKDTVPESPSPASRSSISDDSGLVLDQAQSPSPASPSPQNTKSSNMAKEGHLEVANITVRKTRLSLAQQAVTIDDDSNTDEPQAKRLKGAEDTDVLKRSVKIKDVQIETALNFLVLCRAEETATMFPGTLTSLESEGRPPRKTAATLQGRRRFLLPAWVNENHWVLLVVERSADTIDRMDVYDSLPDPSTNAQVERMARAFISTFFTDKESSSPYLRLRPRLTPRQENMVDCGLYVFITAAHLEAGMPLPTTLNVRLWRGILACILRHQVDEALSVKAIVSSAPTPDCSTPKPSRTLKALTLPQSADDDEDHMARFSEMQQYFSQWGQRRSIALAELLNDVVDAVRIFEALDGLYEQRAKRLKTEMAALSVEVRDTANAEALTAMTQSAEEVTSQREDIMAPLLQSLKALRKEIGLRIDSAVKMQSRP